MLDFKMTKTNFSEQNLKHKIDMTNSVTLALSVCLFTFTKNNLVAIVIRKSYTFHWTICFLCYISMQLIDY